MDWDRENNRLLTTLAETFPEAFAPRGAACWPLKAGIHQDLIDGMPEVKPWRIRFFLVWYTRANRYRRALAAGGVRRDLSGRPAGEVSPSESAYAASLLEARHAAGKAAYKAKRHQTA